jgi:hypothetical protein
MRDDAPYGLDDPQRPPDDSAARGRVTLPAIFLLIVSVLNLLAGLLLMAEGIFMKQGGPDVEAQMQKQWEDMDPKQRDELEKQGWSARDLLVVVANIFLGGGGLTAVVGVLTLFGSIRMLSLHSYGLAMFGAILTAIPFVTPCCLIGQIAGIWAILILLNPDVRKAFR